MTRNWAYNITFTKIKRFNGFQECIDKMERNFDKQFGESQNTEQIRSYRGLYNEFFYISADICEKKSVR